MNDVITIGTVVGTHGVRGTLKVKPTGSFPERFLELKQVVLVAGAVTKTYAVQNAKLAGQLVHLTLDGITSLEDAKLYKSALLQVPDEEAYPLPDGYYYHHQLLGLAVVDQNIGLLGHLKEILETGAHDVYVVAGKNKDYLLPAIPQVIRSVELEEQIMRVEMLPGLEDI